MMFHTESQRAALAHIVQSDTRAAAPVVRRFWVTDATLCGWVVFNEIIHAATVEQARAMALEEVMRRSWTGRYLGMATFEITECSDV